MSRQNSFLGRLPPRARQILTLGGAAAAVLGVSRCTGRAVTM